MADAGRPGRVEQRELGQRAGCPDSAPDLPVVGARPGRVQAPPVLRTAEAHGAQPIPPGPGRRNVTRTGVSQMTHRNGSTDLVTRAHS